MPTPSKHVKKTTKLQTKTLEKILKNNSLIMVCLAVGTLALQGCEVEVINKDGEELPLQKNTVAHINCDENKTLRFREENSSITIAGQCDSISISSKKSTFIIESTKSFQLVGQGNKIHINTPITSAQIAGTSNQLQLDQSKKMAIAGVNNDIKLNTVEKMDIAGLYNHVNVAKLGDVQISGIWINVEYQDGLQPAQPTSVKTHGFLNKAKHIQ